MPLANVFLSRVGPNTLYILVVICCLALAYKLYRKAFSRSIFVSLTNRRLTRVLRPAERRSSAPTPRAEN